MCLQGQQGERKINGWVPSFARQPLRGKDHPTQLVLVTLFLHSSFPTHLSLSPSFSLVSPQNSHTAQVQIAWLVLYQRVYSHLLLVDSEMEGKERPQCASSIKCYVEWALVGVAQWIEGKQKTKGSLVWFRVRAHAWVVGQGPWSGVCERQPHIDVSLHLFLLPFPSL